MKGMPVDMMKMMEQMLQTMQMGSSDIVKCDGKTFMPGFSFENVHYVMNEWDIPKNSVFIASYPKTGEFTSKFVG